MKTNDKKQPHMVRVVSDGLITPDIETELNSLAAMTDDTIDTTDIPEITDWSNAVRTRHTVSLQPPLPLPFSTSI